MESAALRQGARVILREVIPWPRENLLVIQMPDAGDEGMMTLPRQ
jgi:hypothetical protein